MDFLFSAVFAKYEAYFFLVNALLLGIHFIIWITERLTTFYRFVFSKPGVAPSSTETTPAPVKESKKSAAKEEDFSSTRSVTQDERQQVSEIAKLAKTKIARGEFSEARGKVIEGLSIDKFDKELNCILASLYEREEDFRKAEFVYKDLIVVHDTDPELYMKLGFALSMQGKYEIAYEIYKKLLALSDGNNDEAAEMLANLAHHLGHIEEARDYAKLFLKSHPRNFDILYLLAISHSSLGEKVEALQVLEKLKVIDPYNAKIRDLLDKIRLEIELAGNFVVSNTSEVASAPTVSEEVIDTEKVEA